MSVLDGGGFEFLDIWGRDRHEEVPVLGFGFTQSGLRGHVDGFALGVGLVFGRAGFDAQTAAGAVLRGNLNGELVAGEFLEFGIDRFEGFRSILQIARIVNFFANDRVRADRGAFSALDTQVGFPHWDLEGNVAFFPFGRAGRISTIHRESADGQRFAFEGDHGA